jgi:dienelactone hydrolase
MNHQLLRAVFIAAIFLISACSSLPPVSDRIQSADQLAKSAGFKKQLITTDVFNLVSYQKISNTSNDVLVVYIEGDGSAWKNGSLPSDDPTPTNPLALGLAVQDMRPAVAYLSRPCQFTGMPSRGCSESVWTDARFSLAVINSSNQAIEILKKQYQSKELILVGYSGGGAVASLVAAQRNDIKQLVTVAGNLDTVAWVKYFGLNPLAGSLNPADKAKQLGTLKQTHLIGENDQVIPLVVTESYMNKLPTPNNAKLIEIKGYGHTCFWVRDWPNLISRSAP